MNKLTAIAIIPMIFLAGCGAIQQDAPNKTSETDQKSAIQQDGQETSRNTTAQTEIQSQIAEITMVALDGTELANKLRTKQIGCNDKLYSEQTLQAVSPEEALNDLFTRKPQNKDAYNAYIGSNISIKEFTVENGKATVKLTGELRTGGTCDAPRVKQQLYTTLLQFKGISSVDLYINEEPIDDYLSEKG